MIYEYDGSLEGLLCCVFACYEQKTEPLAIQTEDTEQEWLYPVTAVAADPEKAGRVYDALGKKICPEAQEWVQTAFLYGEGGKELAIYRFIRLGLQKGAGVVRMFGHPDVAPIYSMNKAVGGEAHLLTGFIRFSDLGGLLAAEIAPKHFVLPKLADHFTGRYPEEQFLIHDKTHKAALAYRPYESRLFFAEDLRLPDASGEDARFQELWRGYFRSTTITDRMNLLCQRTHCPKRYWGCMTEHSGGILSLEEFASCERIAAGLRLPAASKSLPPPIDKDSPGAIQ